MAQPHPRNPLAKPAMRSNFGVTHFAFYFCLELLLRFFAIVFGALLSNDFASVRIINST